MRKNIPLSLDLPHSVRMTQAERAERNLERLQARRERLRALSNRIADSAECLPLPDTWLGAIRMARSIRVADRICVRFADPEDDWEEDENAYDASQPDPLHRRPLRVRLRESADRLLDAAELIPMPESHLEAERAGRYTLAADRMLEQLYDVPKDKDQDLFDKDREAEDPNNILTWRHTPERVADDQFWRDLLKAQIAALDGKPEDRRERPEWLKDKPPVSSWASGGSETGTPAQSPPQTPDTPQPQPQPLPPGYRLNALNDLWPPIRRGPT